MLNVIRKRFLSLLWKVSTAIHSHWSLVSILCFSNGVHFRSLLLRQSCLLQSVSEREFVHWGRWDNAVRDSIAQYIFIVTLSAMFSTPFLNSPERQNSHIKGFSRLQWNFCGLQYYNYKRNIIFNDLVCVNLLLNLMEDLTIKP